MNILRTDTLRKYAQRVRPILIEVAQQRKLIYYGDLMYRLGGPGRGYIGAVLDEISETELQAKRPKLSALVIRKDTKKVSGGFFVFKDTPNAIKRTTPEQRQNPHLSAADEQYWRSYLQKVYDYWQAHSGKLLS